MKEAGVLTREQAQFVAPRAPLPDKRSNNLTYRVASIHTGGGDIFMSDQFRGETNIAPPRPTEAPKPSLGRESAPIIRPQDEALVRDTFGISLREVANPGKAADLIALSTRRAETARVGKPLPRDEQVKTLITEGKRFTNNTGDNADIRGINDRVRARIVQEARLLGAEREVIMALAEHETSAKRVKTVLENAKRSDAQRVQEAERVLTELAGEKVSLTPEQQQAVLEAHRVGEGQSGKYGEKAGVFDYTRAQLRAKAEILSKAGITEASQRRALIEQGIVGTLEDLIDDIDAEPPGPEQAQKIKEIMRDHFPGVDSPIPNELLARAAIYKETTDEILNRIIVEPMLGETSPYRVGMYADSNYNNLRSYRRAHLENVGRADLAAEEFKHYDSLRNSTEFFHNMNSQVVSGNLEGFVNIGQSITPEHFEQMTQINGVSEAFRFYDQFYRQALIQKGWVSNEDRDNIQKQVEEAMMRANTGNLMESEYLGDRIGAVPIPARLEKWEIDRAVLIGRNVHSITLRSAEILAQSMLPNDPQEMYGSLPQESMVRLMNWTKWIGERWEFNEVRGGLWVLQQAKKIHNSVQEDLHGGPLRRLADVNENRLKGLKDDELNDIGIRRIMAQGLDEFEFTTLFGVTGVFSSWRQNLAILGEVRGRYGGREISVEKFLYEQGVKRGALSGDAKVAQYRRDMMDIIDNTNVALGVLLSTGDLSVSTHDAHDPKMVEAKLEMRQRLLARAFEVNPLVAAQFMGGGVYKGADGKDTFYDYLNSEVKGGREQLRTYKDGRPIDGIRSLHKIVKDEMGVASDDDAREKWDIIAKKLAHLQAARMKEQAANPRTLVKLRDISSDTPLGPLTPAEQAVVDAIQAQAQSAHMLDSFSRVRLPHTAFMDDVNMKDVNWDRPGQEFYKRRAGSDLPHFAKGQSSFAGLIGNPHHMSPDDAMGKMLEIVEAISAPHGLNSAQDRVSAIFEAYLDFIKIPDEYRWDVREAIRRQRQQPLSVAQEYGGYHAPAVKEEALMEIIMKSCSIGLTRKEVSGEVKGTTASHWGDLEHYLLKKFKATKWDVWKANWLRDAWIYIIAGILGTTASNAGKDALKA